MGLGQYTSLDLGVLWPSYCLLCVSYIIILLALSYITQNKHMEYTCTQTVFCGFYL